MCQVVALRTRWQSAIVVAVAIAACDGPAARVTLVPLGDACARPAGGNAVRVTAYAATGEVVQSILLGESAAIDSFPQDTQQIGVEVVVGGGVIGAAGKSAPVDYGGLPDGATIPVMMAPPDGFCEVGAMLEARAHPLVARAGDRVLVVGGEGPDGPLSTAELYDPATARFSSVVVPRVLAEDGLGFAGASLVSLPDGRVALIGGLHNAFGVFDPKTGGFATDPAAIGARAFHAAIAIDDADVLVAGGCGMVVNGVCNAPLRQMQRYRLAMLGNPDPVTRLPEADNRRVGAQLFDLGIQLGGPRRFLLAGDRDEPARVDRFALDDEVTTALLGGHAEPVALDGGAVLTAFAATGAPPDGAASVFAPEGDAARPIAQAPDRAGVRLIALEDGQVAGFGGDPQGRALLYDPTRDAWRPAGAPPDAPALDAPSLARLPDGSVLVLGGAVSARAWVYRPSLVGPASGSVTVVPASESPIGVLTAPDPATVARVAGAWRLTAPADALLARALVGGPRTATGAVTANVHVVTGGVALIAQQTAPGQAVLAELAPGAPVRIVRIDGGRSVVCEAAAAAGPAFDPGVPVELALVIQGGEARVAVDGQEVLACQLEGGARGAWGVAALGGGAQITVESIAVER